MSKQLNEKLIQEQNPKQSKDVKPHLPKVEQPGLNKSGKQILPRN